MKGPITISLVAVPNPDFGETALGIKPEKVQVVHFAAASLVLREWIKKHNLGGGNMGKRCGEIRAAGKLVARVSYNGRIWNLDGTERRPEVFDPPPPGAHPTDMAMRARYALKETTTVKLTVEWDPQRCGSPEKWKWDEILGTAVSKDRGTILKVEAA